MKFEDVYGRCYRGDLSQVEASEILGVSERTFRRWRDRWEAEGAAGLYDRRLGRASARRAPVDTVAEVLELFETRYGLSYNWLRLTLQAHGKIKAAARRGAHRRKRPRRPMAGMLLHQDGSSHEWVAGEVWDLIVTMEDATNEVYSGFFVAEEGTMSTFRGLGEVIAEKGLFCSLYADRASHYWHTPAAGGHRADPGLFAGGPGALGAHVRDPAEAPAPGAAPGRGRHHGRGQPLSRGGLLAGA
jgi:transposase